MSVEFRPASLEEMDQFRYVASTALVMKLDPFNMQPEWTYCAFEDGRLATAYGEWPFTMRFNGDSAPVAAVTMVGTLPVYRRRGHLRRITASRFQLLNEQGERAIAVLYASRAAIYQRYGYAVVSTQNSYNIDPKYLEFSTPHTVSGTFRELADDEFPLLVDLYRRFRADRTGYLHRSRAQWDAGVLAPPPSGGQLNKVVYQEDGEPLGYVVYTMEPQSRAGVPGPDQRLAIRDLVWLTVSAYRAIWDYFTKMDLVGNIVWGRVPVDDPLPHLLLEPKFLNQTSSDGLLGRIVSVERALPQRRYDEAGTLTFEIRDDLCPWNCDRWQLQASTDESLINRTSEEPQVTMPVSTLAMLFFGQLSATEAARMGRLDTNVPDALPLWDRVMHTKYRPACADMF